MASKSSRVAKLVLNLSIITDWAWVAGCGKGLVTCFLKIPQAVAELQLPWCPSKQGEHPENTLQNLLHNLPPQTVVVVVVVIRAREGP